MAIRLLSDPGAIEKRNLWLKYVFFAGKGDGSALKDYINQGKVSHANDEVVRSIPYLYDIIENTKFAVTDGYFVRLADVEIENPDKTMPSTISWTADVLAAFVADMCAELGILWDDVTSNYTSQEISIFRGTQLGQALEKAGCYTSQPQQQSTPSGISSSVKGGVLRLSNAKGLLSQTKEQATGSEVYWIKGDFDITNPKTNPRIHVKPYNGNDPLKIEYATGQGYDDCLVYFFDSSAASAFASKVNASMPAKMHGKALKANSFTVKKCKADSNGYFKVNTEFGPGYILASKLHEMLEEINRQNDAYCEEFNANAEKYSKMTKDEYDECMANMAEEYRAYFD